MSSPAFVEVPGANFDWLNLDTEQGMRVQAGRRGLTLEQINAMPYGVDNLREAGAPIFGARGAKPDRRSIRLGRVAAMPLYQRITIRNWNTSLKLHQPLDAPVEQSR